MSHTVSKHSSPLLARSLAVVLLGFAATLAQADLVVGRIGSTVNPISSPSTVAVGQGFDLYLKRMNGSGYLYGQSVKVVFKDDGFKPEATVKAAKELIENDRVLAIINPQGTPGTAAILRDGMLKRSSTAIIGPFTGAIDVLSGDNIFPMRASYDDEIGAVARQMRTIGQNKVAYLYYKTALGPAYEPTFGKIVKDSGLTYVGSAGFEISADPAVQAKALEEAVRKVAEFKPNAIFIFAVGPTFPMAVKALNRELGRGVSRYTFSINNWENLVKQAGLEDAQGVVFSQSVPVPYSSGRRITREYQKDCAELAPETQPSFAGLEGYMTARMLVEVLHRAGPNPTRERVLSVLTGMGRYDLGDFFVYYSPERRRVESAIDITSISASGKLVR